MGALPLGERRRRIRPTARGDRAHSQGGLWGVRGSRGSLGGILAPPAPHPRCGGAVRGAGAKAGAGSASHACPRPTCGYHGGFHPVGTLSPRITPSPDGSPGCGVQPLTPTNPNLPSREVPAARGLCPALRALPAPAGAAGSDSGGSGWPRGAAPHPTNPNLLPAGRNRRRRRSGGRAEPLVPELRLPSFKLGEFK